MIKEYMKITKEGKVIDNYLLDDENPIPSDYKPSWGMSESYYIPIWDFKLNRWTEGKLIEDILKEARKNKRDVLSQNCQDHILNGFDFKLKGVVYHFSYDREAQLNFQETFQMFQNEMLKSIMWTARLNGEPVRVSLDQVTFTSLYTKSLQHKQDAISRFRDILTPVLNGLQTVDHINALKWDSQVNYPIDSPVVLKEDNTVDVQIGDVKKETQGLKEENEMLTMSLLEVASMIMMAQLEGGN